MSFLLLYCTLQGYRDNLKQALHVGASSFYLSIQGVRLGSDSHTKELLRKTATLGRPHRHAQEGLQAGDPRGGLLSCCMLWLQLVREEKANFQNKVQLYQEIVNTTIEKEKQTVSPKTGKESCKHLSNKSPAQSLASLFLHFFCFQNYSEQNNHLNCQKNGNFTHTKKACTPSQSTTAQFYSAEGLLEGKSMCQQVSPRPILDTEGCSGCSTQQLWRPCPALILQLFPLLRVHFMCLRGLLHYITNQC